MSEADSAVRTAPTESSAKGFEDDTYRAVKRRLLPFLMVCYILAYLDRVNIGFAKLQMLGDLAFSERVYGLGAGLFFVGYILFGIPSNALLHRIGARRWIAGIMIMWGVLSSFTAWAASPTQFFTVRFLLGVAEAGFYPGVILYLTYWFPRARRARITTMFQAAIPLAGIFGGPLSGWILDHFDGRWDLQGWQWLFLIEALPATFVGITALYYLDNDVSSAAWLSTTQKDLLIANLAQDWTPKNESSAGQVFRNWRVWSLGMLVFGLAAGLYAISFWMPTLLKGGGNLSITQVGWLSAIPNLAPLLVMYLFARSSDRYRERRWHVATASLVGGAGLALSVALGDNVILSLICLSVASAGILSALPMQWSLVTAFVGGSGAAAAIALINSIGNLGGVASPILIGWLKDETSGLDVGMYVIAAGAVISAAIALSFPARLVNR